MSNDGPGIYRREIPAEQMQGETVVVEPANEECWLLIGKVGELFWKGNQADYREGAPSSVQFRADLALTWDESANPAGENLVGFMHTHPAFPAFPSERDHRTMRAWVLCFGRPLVCVIKGTDGLRAWWYWNDEDAPDEADCEELGGLIVGDLGVGFPYNEETERKLYEQAEEEGMPR